MTSTKNPFKRFYTTHVEVGKVTGGGGYSNPDGTYIKLGEVAADVQPYSGGLAAEQYGLAEQVEKRMFCNNAAFICPGNIAVADGEKYDIVYVERWELGTMALLKKRRG